MPIAQNAPVAHVLPHAPQFAGSFSVSMQRPLQRVCPAGQSGMRHIPSWQTWFVAQLLPQAPQWFRSLRTSTHAPLQFVSPAAHVRVHMLREQTCPAPHAVPHPPQLRGSLV